MDFILIQLFEYRQYALYTKFHFLRHREDIRVVIQGISG